MLRRALVASLALWVLATGVASAAVSVVPSEVEATPAQLTFRVTNERDASTTAFEVTLPTGAPDVVFVKPLAGWTHAVDGSTIAWTGGTIARGEYVDFDIALASVSNADDVGVATKQTFDDGAVARQTIALVRSTTATATHEHDSNENGLAVLAIVLACIGIVMAAVAFMTRRTNPKDGPDQAPLP